MKKIKELIASGRDYNRIFDEIRRVLDDTKHEEYINEITLLESRFRDIGNEYNRGTINNEKYSIERIKIFNSILKLADEIEKKKIVSEENKVVAFFENITNKVEDLAYKTRTRPFLIIIPILALTLCGILGYNIWKLKYKKFTWHLATTWEYKKGSIPVEEMQSFVDDVYKNTGQRLKIIPKEYGGKEGTVDKPIKLFEQVNNGEIDALYSISYNWVSLNKQSKVGYFFAALPFGKEFEEYDDWFEKGNGKKFWQEYYNRLNYNVYAFPLGHSGKQYGGWFKDSISRKSLPEIYMRIPGLQGDVLKSIGAKGTFFCLQREIDGCMSDSVNLTAVEWLGPHEDHIIGMDKHMEFKHYYKEGWHEHDNVFELLINKNKYDELPSDIKKVLETLMQKYNYRIYIKFKARNEKYWEVLKNKKNDHIETHEYMPVWFIQELKRQWEVIRESECARDTFFNRIWHDYNNHIINQ